jgi:16S rRNA processing protein RimM
VTARPTPPRDGKIGARQTKQDLVAGRIVRPHGVGGTVVFEAQAEWVESLRPGVSVTLGDTGETVRVRSCRAHGRRFLLELEGTTDRSQAERLRGVEVRLPLEAVGPLPEGVYFQWQIIGLRVLSETGEELGVVSDVLQTGANDVYEVQRADGTRILLPAIRSAIRRIDVDGGVMQVVIPEGLPGVS